MGTKAGPDTLYRLVKSLNPTEKAILKAYSAVLGMRGGDYSLISKLIDFLYNETHFDQARLKEAFKERETEVRAAAQKNLEDEINQYESDFFKLNQPTREGNLNAPVLFSVQRTNHLMSPCVRSSATITRVLCLFVSRH